MNTANDTVNITDFRAIYDDAKIEVTDHSHAAFNQGLYYTLLKESNPFAGKKWSELKDKDGNCFRDRADVTPEYCDKCDKAFEDGVDFATKVKAKIA